ncbi:MAG: NAD(P)-binding domain-containing protein [Cyanobacteriota bacterium]|nr:NAD(P)-binding domain-containing protein [Cyanobacteriota bacterium]
MTVAVLGTGLMGRSFVLHLLSSGQQVHVWNRRTEKAKALEASGAVAFDTAPEAVSGVERIHLSLADDGVVDQVLESIAAAAPQNAPIIDHSTTGPRPTAERAARWAQRGSIYLHAPVFMAPENAAAGTGFMLLSGHPDHCAMVMPALEAMASKVLNLGPDPGRAAAFKLMGNLGLLSMSAVAGEVMRLAAACGIEAEEAAGLFAVFNPGDVLPERARKVASGPYEPPSATVAMMRKDVGLMSSEMEGAGIAMALLPVLLDQINAALQREEGGLDVTAAFRYPTP